MKKLLLLLGLCTLTLGLWAKDKPFVIVHKSNGGYLAWLNLYNDITYTPSSDPNVPATLDCYGSGWSFCRVPRISMNDFSVISGGTNNNIANQTAVLNAINKLIEDSESQGQKGALSGTKSKTIAAANGTTYFVKSTWAYNSYGEGDIYIYVNTDNNLLKIR